MRHTPKPYWHHLGPYMNSKRPSLAPNRRHFGPKPRANDTLFTPFGGGDPYPDAVMKPPYTL